MTTRGPSQVRVPGPLAPHADGFRAALDAQGFSPWSQMFYLHLLADVSRWLDQRGLDASGLTDANASAFRQDRRSRGRARFRGTQGLALLLSFLLEQDRGNTARTRNARLAALRSFFKFAALRHPEHAATIARVLAIPAKKHARTSVSYLTADEIKALLAAPDTGTWHGRRDHALLALAAQTGLRCSELTGLTRGDVRTETGPTVRCHGKGRKDRVTPLTANVAAVIRSWLRQQPGDPGDPLFPAITGRRLSSDAVQDLVRQHVATAEAGYPSIQDKNVTPHTLRHSAAMALLHAGVDPVTIALWMGHESPRSTQPYIHADLKLKEKALARTSPPTATTGRYRPPDKLLAFLESLGLCRSPDTLDRGRQGFPGGRRHNRGPGIR